MDCKTETMVVGFLNSYNLQLFMESIISFAHITHKPHTVKEGRRSPHRSAGQKQKRVVVSGNAMTCHPAIPLTHQKLSMICFQQARAARIL